MIRSKIYIMLAVMAVWVVSAPKLANAAAEIDGRGEITYDPGLFSSKPNATDRQRAIAEARKNALSRFTSNFSTAKYALFQRVSTQVLAQPDQYVIGSIVVDEGVNKDAKLYYVVIRATIDDAKLDALLNSQGV